MTSSRTSKSNHGFTGIAGMLVLCQFVFVCTGNAQTARPNAVVNDRDASHDMALIEDLRIKVEALNDEDRYLVGVELSRAILPKLKTDVFRQKVCFSLATLYFDKLKQPEEAKPFFEKVRTYKGLNSRMERIALKRLRSIAAKDMNFVPTGAEQQTTVTKDTNQPDEHFYQAVDDAEYLNSIGRYEEAQQILAVLLPKTSGDLRREVVSHIEVPALRMRSVKKHAESAVYYKQIFDTFPELQKNSPLRSNAIVASSETDDRDQTRTLREAFIADFPNDPGRYTHMNMVAIEHLNSGNSEAAQKYLTGIIEDENAPEDAIQLAKANLGIEEVDRPIARRPWFLIVTVGNAVVITIVVIVMFLRRKTNTVQVPSS